MTVSDPDTSSGDGNLRETQSEWSSLLGTAGNLIELRAAEWIGTNLIRWSLSIPRHRLSLGGYS